jgi:hypothetical protein
VSLDKRHRFLFRDFSRIIPHLVFYFVINNFNPMITDKHKDFMGVGSGGFTSVTGPA